MHEKERSKSQFKTIEIVLGIYGIFWFGEDEPNTDGKTQEEEETSSSSALNKMRIMGTK